MDPTHNRRRFNRRKFLERIGTVTGSVVAASLIVPASALGRGGVPAPSERITLGFIGVGMMGQGHLRVCLGYDNVQVLAICDVDRWRRENARSRVEQASASSSAGGQYRGCSTYGDLRELLQRDDIDAVVIATGDNWHGLASVLAAKAGKDIYCEKPISKTIHEARAMVDAARRYERVFQIGLQQRTTAEFRTACDLVQRGRLGRIRRVYVAFPGTSSNVNLAAEEVPEGLDWDQWLGPAPWRPFNARFHSYGEPPRVVPWHFCRDFGGGNLTSNAVHAFDVVQWGLGMDRAGPVEIIPPETGTVPDLTYRYANGIQLHVVNWHLNPEHYPIPPGWDPKTRLQNFGALFVGDEGWIHVGRAGFLEGHPADILDRPAGGGGGMSSVANHHQDWFSSIRNRTTPACDVSVGCQSTIVSHLGCIAHWTGRAVKWNPDAETFVGDDEACRLQRRALREPWAI